MGNKYHNGIVEGTALHHDYDDLKLLAYLRLLFGPTADQPGFREASELHRAIL